MQLFCLTYAGGSASFFNALEKYMGSSIQVVKLEYAGHGTRHKENFYQDFSQLAKDLYQIISAHYRKGESYALLGYSMGSICAVEILKLILQANHMPPPVHIFLAAHAPCPIRELSGYSAAEQDEQIKFRTMRFGGVPESLAANRSFWRVYLPVYRADYTLIGGYDFRHLNLESKIPATVFYSETDTPYTDMAQWKRFFVGQCEFVRFEGNHFFIQEHCQEMADIIKERLSQDEL